MAKMRKEAPRSLTSGGSPRTRRRLFKLASLACLILAAGSECASPQATPTTVTDTVEALRAGDFTKALSMARELVRARPEDPRAWTLEGMALSRLGRTEESLKAFDQALKLNPEFVPAIEAAAQTAYKNGRPEASTFLETLIRLNPHEQTAHAMLGTLAYNRKDCESAIAHFNESRQIIDNDASALSEYGFCLAKSRQTKNAIVAYTRLCELRPQDSQARYNLGALQYQAHLHEAAIETLQPMVDGPKPSVETLNLIAAAYEANRQTPLAVAALQQAIKLAPRDINNYLDLATICLDHGSFQVGVDILNAAIQAIPDSAALYLERGVLLVQMLKYDQAASDFEMADKLSPQQNISTLALGISLLQENKLDESVQVVKQRLAKAPDDPDLNYLLAELFIRKGVEPGTLAFQQAMAAAERALRKQPGFNLAADTLTELYLRSGQTALAERISRQALKSDPNDQSALYHLIVCLRKKGDLSELPGLVQRLGETTARLREQEEARNRFKLVEEKGGRSPQQ